MREKNKMSEMTSEREEGEYVREKSCSCQPQNQLSLLSACLLICWFPSTSITALYTVPLHPDGHHPVLSETRSSRGPHVLTFACQF